LILFDPSNYKNKKNKKITLSIIIIHVITILNIVLINFITIVKIPINLSFYVYIIPKETNILQIQIKKKENG
jgi:hypothetical protein